MTQLATHEVTNQPPALENYDLYDLDRPLVEAIERNSASWASDRLHTFGQVCGSEEMLENGRLANKFPPELKTHDRYGHRIDEVEYHPFRAIRCTGFSPRLNRQSVSRPHCLSSVKFVSSR